MFDLHGDEADEIEFRSPNEFIPHVDWILSTSNIDDHSTVYSRPCQSTLR